jgi:hypothetical protein
LSAIDRDRLESRGSQGFPAVLIITYGPSSLSFFSYFALLGNDTEKGSLGILNPQLRDINNWTFHRPFHFRSELVFQDALVAVHEATA